MPPITRSVAGGSAKPSTSKHEPDNTSDWHSEHSSTRKKPRLRSQEERQTLQSLLTRALGGAKELESENDALRKRIDALESRLDRFEADDAPLPQPRRGKKAPATTADLRIEVARLGKQVQRLEKSNEKYRKRVEQLSMKELKTEAEDLVDVTQFEVGDSAHTMRKLLRRFADLMLKNSLEANEECLICFGSLQPKQARSLPCQHTFCCDCVQRLVPVPGQAGQSISCPQCRKFCPREEAELVEYTASEIWDALLEVAAEWARVDVRREEDTTDEEDEEEFIVDDQEDSSTTASEPVQVNPPTHGTLDSPEDTDEEALSQTSRSRLRRRRVVRSPPDAEPSASTAVIADSAKQEQPSSSLPLHPPSDEPGPSSQSYSQAPSRDKRKMLEQLAEARSKKRKQ